MLRLSLRVLLLGLLLILILLFLGWPRSSEVRMMRALLLSKPQGLGMLFILVIQAPILAYGFGSMGDLLKGRAQYSNNAICLQSYCINPLFPALDAMKELEKDSYECQTDIVTTRGYLDFCYAVMTYDFSLPQAKGKEGSVADVVNVQEQTAATYYAYHLAGMGYEYSDFMEPWKSDDECVKSVWRLSCLTVFPQCNKLSGKENFYMRPCKSACQTYLQECGVECCDESVSCVFDSEQLNSDGTSSKQRGYVDHNGPSPLCTGGAKRELSFPFAAGLLGVIALALRW